MERRLGKKKEKKTKKKTKEKKKCPGKEEQDGDGFQHSSDPHQQICKF